MKLSNANKIRAELVQQFIEFLENDGQDVGQITSNCINFPVVVDGEEGWIEVVIKVPKDDGDEGYDKREEYKIKLKEKEEKRKENEIKKQKKIEKDKKKRLEKELTKLSK